MLTKIKWLLIGIGLSIGYYGLQHIYSRLSALESFAEYISQNMH